MLRVYIADIERYNAGVLKGVWLKLPMESEDMWNEVHQMLGKNEELAIHDYECDIPLKINEYSDLEELNNKAKFIYNLEDYQLSEFEALLELVDFNEAKDIFESQNYIFLSEVEDEYDLGEFWIQEFYSPIPEWLEGYIDYKSFGRDMTLGGWYITQHGAICIN